MNKTIRLFMLWFAALALLGLVSARPAAAAAPTNTFPGGAAYIDNQTHSIAANTSLWYQFDYAGDRSAITVTFVNGNQSGIQFDVFTPAQIGDWWETPPIGRGTAQTLDCSTGLPDTSGTCLSNDLTWTGNFNANGTYYVEVVNTNSSGPQTFQLTIQGTGVTLAAQPMTATSQPTATPQPATSGSSATTATATSTNTFPGGAAVLDNQPHTIPANGSLWYRFNYVSNHTQVTVTLVNGTSSGLGFNVFTSGQLGDWWDESPVGRGTTQRVNCANGTSTVSGGCQSSDLTWAGSFNDNGTYYVQVWNDNSTPTTAQVTIQGAGVSMGQ